MKPQISNKLAASLAHLEPDQLDQLIKRAAVLRERANDESPSLDRWVQIVMKKEERALQRVDETRAGTVVGVLVQEVLVETDEGTLPVIAGMRAVVVGDRVRIGQVQDQWMIVGVEDRRTKLSRPDVDHGGERLIAANVDDVVIVVSVVSPPLHPRLIDRYLIAVENGGARPVICVNKVDLLEDETELEVLDPYRRGQIPVITCSAFDNRGIEELRRQVAGRMLVFVGHSGVGKSSLINSFAGLGLKTGDVSAGYGRGTHTTTVSSLHRLADGTVLIDTPGVRSFGLWAAGVDDVAAAFPEILDVVCRFRNCSHSNEPGCGVLEAVAEGRMREDRYEAMMRLRQEVG